MLKVILATAVAITSIGWISVANAQRTTTSSVTMSDRSKVRPPPYVQTPPSDTARTPAFTLFGLPTYITTPVAAPYANSAYQNFAGQPQRSSESLLAESWRGP